MKTIHLSLVIACLLLLSGCTKDNDGEDANQNFNEVFGGKPYKGTAKGVLFQNETPIYTWDGEGRIALIEATADSVSIVFMADFGNDDEMNIKLRGKLDGAAYLMETTDPDNFFRIVDEKITGQINNAQQQMIFDGSLRRETAAMNMRVTFKEATDVFPAGSVLELTFDTRRTIDDNDDGEGCQMRLVPIWSPSGVTMGMVPDC